MGATACFYGEACRSILSDSAFWSVGDCFGDAMDESFFARLECELIDRRAFPTDAQARMTIFATGRHNEEVHGGELGYSKAKLNELEALQVIRGAARRWYSGVPTGRCSAWRDGP